VLAVCNLLVRVGHDDRVEVFVAGPNIQTLGRYARPFGIRLLEDNQRILFLWTRSLVTDLFKESNKACTAPI
jgi:hypothetical protein